MIPPQFPDFEAHIRHLPTQPQRADVVVDKFRLATDGPVSVYYAPLHGVMPTARIVIVGLTPGLAQMTAAFAAARELLECGWTPPALFHEVRRRMAFAGSMRAHLLSMLDELRVPARLGIASAAELFGERASLLHATSAFRYPVLVDGRNYTGHQPPLGKSALLRTWLEATLPRQLAELPNTLIVPLGKAVELALDQVLADDNKQPVLRGFPHPSGANAHRPRQFAANAAAMRAVIAHWHPLD